MTVYYRTGNPTGLFEPDTLRSIARPATLPSDLSGVSDEALEVLGVARQPEPPECAHHQRTVWTDDGWTVEDIPLDDLRAAKRAEVTALRYTLETGGTVVDGVPVDTSRESQSLITGAALAASLDPAYTVRWKCADGVFREFDAPTVTALATAVRSHVQACFNAEAAHHTALDALDNAESLAGYDCTAGWATTPEG